MSPGESESRSRGLTTRGVLIALIAPLVAALFSIPLGRGGPASAIALFMLAIVIAAVAGGLWSGLIAAIFSSIVVPLLFSTPRYTLRLGGAEDLVTAVVFLAVAVIVGLLVGGASEERARAGRREREARLLGYLSTKLLSGEVPDRVLDDFATVLLDPFGLASCEIVVELDGQPLHATATRPDSEPGGPTALVPLMVGTLAFGTLEVRRPQGRRPLTKDELLLLEAAAKQAAAALDRARLDARARVAQLDAETNQLRAAMFSSVTHDLRTPLTSIKAGVTSLLDASAHHDADQQRELLTTILEETDRLNRLVGNILDLTRVRAGGLILARTPASVDEIVGAVVTRMRPRLTNVVITTKIRDDLPDVVVDPMQMDQVLTNLLENAARYSPQGEEIQLSASGIGKAVQLRIADRGPGIPEDERERVFEAFYRGETSPETPGSGLGLAIAQAIIVAHGGRIWIEPAPVRGTVVVFEIPVDESVGGEIPR
jgi:two-component system, OmpR family, sensor histidine kinase KdpD